MNTEFHLVMSKEGFSIRELFTGGGKNSYLFGAAYRCNVIARNIPKHFHKLYVNSLAQNGYVAEEVKQEKGLTRFYKGN